MTDNDIREAAAALAKKHGVGCIDAGKQWNKGLANRGDSDVHPITVHLWCAHHHDAYIVGDILFHAALLAAREDEAGMIQSALADAREEMMLAERERCAEILLAKQTELDDEAAGLCGSDALVHEYFFCGDASVMIGFLVDAIRNPATAPEEADDART